jgi:hypothetical protein
MQDSQQAKRRPVGEPFHFLSARASRAVKDVALVIAGSVSANEHDRSDIAPVAMLKLGCVASEPRQLLVALRKGVLPIGIGEIRNVNRELDHLLVLESGPRHVDED